MCVLIPLAGGDYLIQVHALLGTVVNKRSVQFVFYDNACALARFSRMPSRSGGTDISRRLADLVLVLDSFHIGNHTACVDPDNSLYMPEVLRNQHGEIQDVNTQSCEQFFAWIDDLCPIAYSMTPAVYKMFVLLVSHWFNELICGRTPLHAQRLLNNLQLNCRQCEWYVGDSQ